MSKPLRAVVVGLGNRGQVYADYSLDCPEELSIVGVVDVNPFKRAFGKERYGLSDEAVFDSLDAFLSLPRACDIVINATMDQDHYETGMKILSAGYDMLIEKPIVPCREALEGLVSEARKHSCRVFVCHVLRYTPFYRTIKQLLLDGEIGEIMSMEMNEHVCLAHYLTSYDRGKWNSEDLCGSGMLLAKCCHDMDLIAWLNNATAPERVASFGSRRFFVKEKAPEGATEYCKDCLHRDTCVMSAKNMHLDMNVMPFLTWDALDKPLDSITMDEKKEHLAHSNFGRCAYIAGGNLIDRQNLIIEFQNGSVANFMLATGTVKADRYIHLVGTKGEIEGKLEENALVLRKHALGTLAGSITKIDCSKQIVNRAKYGGHSGGDFALMHDLCAYYRGETPSLSMTSIEDSVNSHLIVYAAEESRKNHREAEVKGL